MVSDIRRGAGDIEEMGRRLANEVVAYVEEVYGSVGVGRISFIGHSLGGIIGKCLSCGVLCLDI